MQTTFTKVQKGVAHPQAYLFKEAFPSLGVTHNGTIQGLSDVGNPLVPIVDENYVHNKDLVIDLHGLFLQPFSEGLYIQGHTGTGKTSGVVQFHAALKRPLISLNAHGRMTADDLIGFFALVAENSNEQPVMKFNYGPLPRAMKEGATLLINEIDLIDPAELASLNEVLDGRPLVIAANGGEVIKPHHDFRIIVTANSKGGGDELGLYQGVQVQNMASLDRYRFSEVDYLEKEVEVHILKKMMNGVIPDAILTNMVEVANGIRKLFIGEQGYQGSISTPMSTRTLCRWARLTPSYLGGKENAIELAFKKSFSMRLNDAEKEATHRVLKDVFGDSLNV